MRVLLISDVHANPFALRVLPQADVVLCAGDLVDYGPDPRAAVAWCRSRARVVVHGNHDRALAFDEPDGVSAAMREASAATRELHRAALQADDIAYLRELPRVAVVRLEGVVFALTHAVADDPCRYAALGDAADSVRAAVPEANVVVVGHTHVQQTLARDGIIAVNPGSVGMGSQGGIAHYAVWKDGAIAFEAVPYDLEAMMSALDALPLPDVARTTLETAFRHGRHTKVR
jgi:putative phosphoesterase